jgi:hypothetical protein
VRQQKRALDSALARFRLLTKDDRLFAVRSARELLRYFLAAGWSRLSGHRARQ